MYFLNKVSWSKINAKDYQTVFITIHWQIKLKTHKLKNNGEELNNNSKNTNTYYSHQKFNYSAD